MLERAPRELGFHITSGKIHRKITGAGNRGLFLLKGLAQLATQAFQRAAPSLVPLQLCRCQGKDANLQPQRICHPQARCWSVPSVFLGSRRSTSCFDTLLEAGASYVSTAVISPGSCPLRDGEEGKLKPSSLLLFTAGVAGAQRKAPGLMFSATV